MIDGIRISYVGRREHALATVQHLRFSGKNQLDGALKTGDVQRLVREVQNEDVAHGRRSSSESSESEALIGASLSYERHSGFGQHLRDR